MAGNTTCGGPKKRMRVVGTSSRVSSTSAVIVLPNESLAEVPYKPLPPLPRIPFHASSKSFNDSTTADVILRLYLEDSSPFSDDSESISDDTESISAVDTTSDVQIYLHSSVLHRSKYFAALLSDRWKDDDFPVADSKTSSKHYRFKFGVPASAGSITSHVSVLQLLYSDDISTTIDSVAMALELLPIALEFLFEDCVTACVRFLEAVPWTEDEEKIVLSLIPFLSEEESLDLLARVSRPKTDLSEEMLHGLILTAIHNHPNMASAKAFVAKILREFSSKECARRVLDSVFDTSLKTVMESLEEYSSPDFRGDHQETEAYQRLNLYTAMKNGRHLLWLIERMIELRVADTAVEEWSEQVGFTADLQRAFRDDSWRNIVPGLPAVVLRCTCKLASAVASGVILANKQVRTELVKAWLPVLIVCKDNITPMLTNHKSLYLELEETFLRIISTLPMADAQGLLQQCLSFSTRNVEDCGHLVSAFTTWFRRANRPFQLDLQPSFPGI